MVHLSHSTLGGGGVPPCARTVPNMTESDSNSSIKRKYNDLSLDLNLDQVTADEAWANYENIKLKYTLEVGQTGVCFGWCTCCLEGLGRRVCRAGSPQPAVDTNNWS